VGKIRGQNSIIAQIYLPKPEFRKFIDTLAKLIRMGLLEGYNYVVQDIREGTWFREELHPELFKHGIWIYDHKKHIKDLHDAVLRHCNTLNIEPEAF
jgi:hypothetical protein